MKNRLLLLELIVCVICVACVAENRETTRNQRPRIDIDVDEEEEAFGDEIVSMPESSNELEDISEGDNANSFVFFDDEFDYDFNTICSIRYWYSYGDNTYTLSVSIDSDDLYIAAWGYTICQNVYVNQYDTNCDLMLSAGLNDMSTYACIDRLSGSLFMPIQNPDGSVALGDSPKWVEEAKLMYVDQKYDDVVIQMLEDVISSSKQANQYNLNNTVTQASNTNVIDRTTGNTEYLFAPLNPDAAPDKLPNDFRNVYVKINGSEVESWTNDRYYIFYAQASTGNADWYIYDQLEKLYVRYDSSFMAGSGVMVDKEARGVEDNSGQYYEFTPLESPEMLTDIPNGFREINIRINGIEIPGYANEDNRYYIFYAWSDGYKDWFVYDFEEKNFIRYEPSFMMGN